jgi:hypothetical protein
MKLEVVVVPASDVDRVEGAFHHVGAAGKHCAGALIDR